MDKNTQATALISRYGFIEAHGVDAPAFVQSQLSADIAALEQEQTVLTGWHDPKGRVLSCLKVVRKQDGFLLVLPKALVEPILTGLSRYVMRSKVTLTDVTEQMTAAAVLDGTNERYEIYAAKDELAERVKKHHAEGVVNIDQDAWELSDIRAGMPEVYPQTSGMFTGQMLNLDLIGGISFTKGCYPGQEIIARTHHLGKVKRRMQRYICDAPPRIPGESLFTNDGRRAGQVVRSAPTKTGSESLVVTSVETPTALTDEDGAILHPDKLPYNLV